MDIHAKLAASLRGHLAVLGTDLSIDLFSCAAKTKAETGLTTTLAHDVSFISAQFRNLADVLQRRPLPSFTIFSSGGLKALQQWEAQCLTIFGEIERNVGNSSVRRRSAVTRSSAGNCQANQTDCLLSTARLQALSTELVQMKNSLMLAYHLGDLALDLKGTPTLGASEFRDIPHGLPSLYRPSRVTKIELLSGAWRQDKIATILALHQASNGILKPGPSPEPDGVKEKQTSPSSPKDFSDEDFEMIDTPSTSTGSPVLVEPEIALNTSPIVVPDSSLPTPEKISGPKRSSPVDGFDVVSVQPFQSYPLRSRPIEQHSNEGRELKRDRAAIQPTASSSLSLEDYHLRLLEQCSRRYHRKTNWEQHLYTKPSAARTTDYGDDLMTPCQLTCCDLQRRCPQHFDPAMAKTLQSSNCTTRPRPTAACQLPEQPTQDTQSANAINRRAMKALENNGLNPRKLDEQTTGLLQSATEGQIERFIVAVYEERKPGEKESRAEQLHAKIQALEQIQIEQQQNMIRRTQGRTQTEACAQGSVSSPQLDPAQKQQPQAEQHRPVMLARGAPLEVDFMTPMVYRQPQPVSTQQAQAADQQLYLPPRHTSMQPCRTINNTLGSFPSSPFASNFNGSIPPPQPQQHPMMSRINNHPTMNPQQYVQTMRSQQSSQQRSSLAAKLSISDLPSMPLPNYVPFPNLEPKVRVLGIKEKEEMLEDLQMKRLLPVDGSKLGEASAEAGEGSRQDEGLLKSKDYRLEKGVEQQKKKKQGEKPKELEISEEQKAGLKIVEGLLRESTTLYEPVW